MSVSAHDVVQTRDCKTPGCTGIATATRGPYAGLCDDCKKRKASENSERQKAVWDRRRGAGGAKPEEPPNRSAKPPTALINLEELAKRIPPHAKKLQHALDRRDQARLDAGTALADLNDCLQEFSAAAKALVAGNRGPDGNT